MNVLGATGLAIVAVVLITSELMLAAANAGLVILYQ
jgi:hypothetical protein